MRTSSHWRLPAAAGARLGLRLRAIALALLLAAAPLARASAPGEPRIRAAVKGTPLLQGGPADYWLALAIAVAFPLVRLLLDATVYDVSVTKCCFGAPGSPRCPRPRAHP